MVGSAERGTLDAQARIAHGHTHTRTHTRIRTHLCAAVPPCRRPKGACSYDEEPGTGNKTGHAQGSATRRACTCHISVRPVDVRGVCACGKALGCPWPHKHWALKASLSKRGAGIATAAVCVCACACICTQARHGCMVQAQAVVWGDGCQGMDFPSST